MFPSRRHFTIGLPRRARPAGALVWLASWLLAAAALRGAADTARLPAAAYPAVAILVEAGRPADALAELDRQIGAASQNDLPLEAVALRAALLEDVGRHRKSAEAWDVVARRDGSLAALARRRAAEALIAAGDPDGAVERLGRPSRSGPARANHDLLVAAAAKYREQGEPDQAESLARSIATLEGRGPLADAARLELAAALEASGHPVGAIAVLRDSERNFSTAAAFLRARQAERRLVKTIVPEPAPFAEREYRTIAGRLSDAARFAEAIEVLREWRSAYPQSSTLDEIDADVVDNLYRMRANDEARKSAAAFVASHPPSPLLARVRVLQFRLDVRDGRTAGVKSTGLALWRGMVAGLALSERWSVGSLLAAYLVSVGEVDEGLSVYRELFGATTGRAAQADVLWRAGVAAYRAGQFDRAASNLRAAIALRPGLDTADLATYWLAAVEDKLGKRQDAVDRLSGLVRQSPYSYYGLRAAERLTAMGVSPPSPLALTFPDLELQPTTLKRPEFRAASVLARAGLQREAAAAARDLARAVRSDRAATILAARASQQAGEYRAALGLLGTALGPYLESPATGMPDDFMRLVYPRAFWDDVRQAAGAQRVDPLLMLALMRRESRFDPGARSAAGATGLFQIMPYTADALAPKVGIAKPDEVLLTQVPANATIAAALVRRLLDLFDGRAVAVMAAFNAGEDRVGAWWQAEQGLPEDLFVDTIPYNETRTYVREVWVNYEMYQRLYRR